MRRTGTPYHGVRAWVVSVVGLILAGAGWVAVHLVVAEHDSVAAISLFVLAAAILVGNCRAARAPEHPGPTGTVREGHAWVPDGRAGRRHVPEIRLTDEVEPPRPKLGAPGSLN